MKLSIIVFTSFYIYSYKSWSTNFKIDWVTEGLPISVEVQRLQGSIKSRVGETGELTDKIILPPGRLLKEKNLLILNPDEDAYLILIIKNNSNKKLNFGVAPHSTDPGAASLGFSFTCLCNGHVYDVGPKKTWYRILRLKTEKQIQATEVKLTHVIFSAKQI